MAPGGVEPPHTDSKSVALSTELRGRSNEFARTLLAFWRVAGGRVRRPQPAAGQDARGGGGDSNPRPPGPQPGALPTELPPPRSEDRIALAGEDWGQAATGR